MNQQKIAFERSDVEANKTQAALGYILFFLPLLSCGGSRLGRFCANQGLLLMIAYMLARMVCGLMSFLFIFDFLYELAMNLLDLAALALGVFMTCRLIRNDKISVLPFIGGITLIK